MWVVQLLPVAYTEKLPTVWLALGKSQEQPRSEVKGTSEVQRREGIRICSYSESWQSQAAFQDKKTPTKLYLTCVPRSGIEYRCHSPSSTQWPQPGDLPRTCLCAGCSHRYVGS